MADQFLEQLLSKQRIFITTHIRPDGDAIGSQLSLGLFLESLGKEVVMINSDHIPDNLSWMPAVEKVKTFDKSLKQRELIDQADLIVVVDTNALDRIGDLAPVVKTSNAPKFLIDHHTNPETWFSETYARVSAASTAELIYELIASHNPDLITPTIATALYVGIVTDTGSFRYSAVVPELHRVVADILERGELSPTPIHVALYDNRSLSSLRLLSRALATITLKYEEQLGYMIIPQKLLRDLQADSDETDGFVNYALSIRTVKVALLFLETAKGTKVSFRSKGDAAVNTWAQSFGGGGHKNASGAFLRKSLESTISEVVESAPRFLDFAKPPTPSTHDTPGEDQLSEEDASYLSSLLGMKDD
ncbi:MAG: bifunctional oligoribonuclease/PAP phosphatase NrnA [Rhodothermaceae bacterium]|nr:bifunctional oligoribonuclease/PAP phosphatase NrnA [Rhodothermaceae bacterium]